MEVHKLIPSAHMHSSACADASYEIDSKACQVWQARAGVHAFMRYFWFMWPLRIAQLLHSGRTNWNLWFITGVVMLLQFVIHQAVVGYENRRMPTTCKGRIDPSETKEAAKRLERDWCFYVIAQLGYWAISLLSLAMICYTFKDDFRRDRAFWGTMVPWLVMQCAVHYLPRWVYFAVVFPVNFGMSCVYLYCVGRLNFTDFLQIVGMLYQCFYVFTFKGETDSELYHARLAAERAQRTTEVEHKKADAWQKAFQGVLKGVFDARCVCDLGGVIWTSTPQLDQLLLEGGDASNASNRLRGFDLPAFASGSGERRRMEVFLAGLSTDGAMQKMQLSLARHQAGCGSKDLEVSVCGIALPEDVAEEGSQILLCFQIASGLEPVDVGEDSVGLGSPIAAMVRNLLTVEESPREHSHLQRTCDSEDCASSIGAGLRMGHTRSRVSAPPVLTQPETSLLKAASANACAKSNGDCLPPDAVVWVEGQSMPSRVGEIGSGQRVLCYDHLTGGLKYSDVVDVQTRDASTTEWVSVVLEDGTELQMTSDHPVYPQVAGAGPGSSTPVRAAELQASAHSLEVLRLVPVPVREVRIMPKAGRSVEPASSPPDAAPTERVSLSVRQPERHSIFVASGPSVNGGVAVASASVDVQAASQWLRVKNTFIAGQGDSDDDSLPRVQRAGSAPPGVRSYGFDREAERPTQRSMCRSSSAGSDRTYASSFASSAATMSMWGGAGTRIVIGEEPADRKSMDPDPELEQREAAAALKLSPVLEAKRQGLRSLGSLGHCAGSCCPCLMESWHRAGKSAREPCKWGFMCTRCHEDHDPQEVATFRRQRRRDARRLRAAA
mmetsp:Transcript_126083/g.315064  ORF Transcript_126083/g.315064 Transcript_126083/m.315064 type:complete len:836 (-) Transcript_126083:93-2600(-)